MATKTYRNAPLVLTVLEAVHPQYQLTRPQAEEMKSRLRQDLPLLETDQAVELTVDISTGAQHTSTTDWLKLTSRDRRTSLSCSPTKTVLETSNYQGWEEFRPLFERCLEARLDCSGLDGLARIGLRYIDEVRIPQPKGLDWSRWVRAELRPPMTDLTGLDPLQQQSQVQYATGQEGVTVTMRYGLVDGPPAYLGPLRPSPPGLGNYFLFDTDAAWTLPSNQALPAVDLNDTSERIDSLHEWSKLLFEWWPTDALRKEVFDED